MSKSYDEMSIDELHEAFHQVTDPEESWQLREYFLCRMVARDAILDLQESMEERGEVVVPRVATPAMAEAGSYYHDALDPIVQAEVAWEVMIAASPLPSPAESKGG